MEPLGPARRGGMGLPRAVKAGSFRVPVFSSTGFRRGVAD
jgi:hypothetical protein